MRRRDGARVGGGAALQAVLDRDAAGGRASLRAGEAEGGEAVSGAREAVAPVPAGTLARLRTHAEHTGQTVAEAIAKGIERELASVPTPRKRKRRE